MNTPLFFVSAVLSAAFLTGCSGQDSPSGDDGFRFTGHGLYIANEGNFQYGNATLSHYNPATREVENEIFYRANGMRLGDVAQSVTLHGKEIWIAVNNSHVVFSINPENCKETGRVTGLTSPRYIHFLSDTKAYVSQLWDNRILIINPKTHIITGEITVPDMESGTGSTEQMAGKGKYVYCNCWSYQDRIIRIDTESDKVDASIRVGMQPNSLAIDCNGKLWTATDGVFGGSRGEESYPAIIRIDAESMTIEQEYRLPAGTMPCELQTSSDGKSVYWINDDVWKMDVTSTILPSTPLIESKGTRYYGLTTDPENGDVYIADAIDYQQRGCIYRYTKEGVLTDAFYVGVSPGSFAWH